MKWDPRTRNKYRFALHPKATHLSALATSIELMLSRSKLLPVYAIVNPKRRAKCRNLLLYNITSRLSPPHPAPVMSRGPTCFAMLKPKRLANHRIAYTKQGERRSSVWWRNGRAESWCQLSMVLVGKLGCGLTVVS